MSFRHDGKKSHAWRQWLDGHRDDLLKCGIPDFFLTSEHAWVLLLQEGWDPRWHPGLLNPDQQRALHAFVQREYGDQTYRSLLHDLEVLLASSKSNES